MEIIEKKLNLPLKAEDLEQLHIGDVVYLDGLIFTSRVRFYERVLVEGQAPPFDIAARCNVNFHCSPAVSEDTPGHYKITAVTGTASFRFARYLEPLFARYGVKAIIGKGGMPQHFYQTVFRKYGAVYLSTVGYGLGALYGRGIVGVEDVYWKEELGLAQALWIIRVKEFGPLIVDCDLEGRSLQAELQERVRPVFSQLLNRYPLATLKRSGEIPDATHDVV